MPLEPGEGPGDHINVLNRNWPLITDPKEEGAAHIRTLKNTVLNTFPALDAPVTADVAELNKLDGLQATQAELDRNQGSLREAQQKHGIYGGICTTGGAIPRTDLPAGWTQITTPPSNPVIVQHNLGHTNYSVVAVPFGVGPAAVTASVAIDQAGPLDFRLVITLNQDFPQYLEANVHFILTDWNT